ncbi:hypothetical protein SLS62_011178 [Diatrype stigma]|uniref:Protein kinase domain-containing protein n=1 Tax=Diatrype stigma TaxID=117547 RepID=A0AAN9YFY2_9PEZI
MNSPRASDLVQDAKLQTSFRGNITQHTYYTSMASTRRRKVRVDEIWKRQRELGNGTYGRVWLEVCLIGPKQGEYRAVKEVFKEPDAGRKIEYEKELEAIMKFSHKKSFGWYEDNNMVYIAMEFMEHGDLQKQLGVPIPEPEAQAIALQVLEGLQFMHENGFTHRDLKPGNILVLHPAPEWWVKIGDFGISKRAEGDSTALRSLVGTQGYLAPEILGLFTDTDKASHQNDDASYTSAVDIWAMGEICFRLIANQPVFHTRRELFNYVINGLDFPVGPLVNANASANCIGFIKAAMAASPSSRPTASKALSHRWIALAEEAAVSTPISEKRRSWGHLAPAPLEFEASAAWSTLNKPQIVTSARPKPDLGKALPTIPSIYTTADWGSSDETSVLAPLPSKQVIGVVEYKKRINQGRETHIPGGYPRGATMVLGPTSWGCRLQMLRVIYDQSLENLVQETDHEYPKHRSALVYKCSVVTLPVYNADNISRTPSQVLKRGAYVLYHGTDEALRSSSVYKTPFKALTEEYRRVVQSMESTEESIWRNKRISKSQDGDAVNEGSGKKFRWEDLEGIQFPLEPAEEKTPKEIRDNYTSQEYVDDAFWWAWMSSRAPEETPQRRSAFGRSYAFEIDIPGRQWILVEEFMRPTADKPDPTGHIAKDKWHGRMLWFGDMLGDYLGGKLK